MLTDCGIRASFDRQSIYMFDGNRVHPRGFRAVGYVAMWTCSLTTAEDIMKISIHGTVMLSLTLLALAYTGSAGGEALFIQRNTVDSAFSGARTSCDNSVGLPPVGDQVVAGSCYAWAVAYYHGSYLQGQDYGWDLTDPAHQCSPAFVYNLTNGGRDNANYDGQQPRHDAF